MKHILCIISIILVFCLVFLAGCGKSNYNTASVKCIITDTFGFAAELNIAQNNTVIERDFADVYDAAGKYDRFQITVLKGSFVYAL